MISIVLLLKDGNRNGIVDLLSDKSKKFVYS